MTDLTTLSSFKAYSGVVISTDDVAISNLITAYSEFTRSYCSRTFTPQAFSARFDGRNNTRQMLPEFPILTVTAVAVGTTTIAAQSTFGANGYRFDETTVMLDGYRFTKGEGNVLIAWTAGFATIPPDLAQAVNELVGLRYTLRDKQGWSSKSLAGETVSLITKDMPASAKTVLDYYSRVVPG